MDRAVCTSEDWFYIRPVASFFFFRGGAIQGGDRLNETGGTGLLSGKLDCLKLYYEFFSKAFVFIKLLKFKSERRYFIYNFCSENDNIYVTI